LTITIITELVKKIQLQSYLKDNDEESQRRQQKGEKQNLFQRLERAKMKFVRLIRNVK
jgi:hypothetical protein